MLFRSEERRVGEKVESGQRQGPASVADAHAEGNVVLLVVRGLEVEARAVGELPELDGEVGEALLPREPAGRAEVAVGEGSLDDVGRGADGLGAAVGQDGGNLLAPGVERGVRPERVRIF